MAFLSNISKPASEWAQPMIKNESNEWSGMSVAMTEPGSVSRRGSLDHWIKAETEFRPHQVEGIKWLKPKTGAILGDEMGLGKTIQMLGVFAMQIWDTVKINPERRLTMVVVVPPSLRMNWADEIEKFTHLDYEVATGNTIARFSQLERFRKQTHKHRIIVLNYQQVKDHIQQLNAFGIDMLVFDEAHIIKNPLTKVYRSASALKAKRTFCMTGTPMMNQVDDLWTLLDLVTPGQWQTHAAFKAKYCVMGGHNGKQVISIKNEALLRTKLSQVMLRRRIDEVMDLPEVNIVRRNVSLDGKPKEMYNHLVREQNLNPWLPWVPKDPDDEKEVNPLEWPMVRQLKLRQICSSTATLFGGKEDDSPKLDLAIEDALEMLENGHKIVVFSQWREITEAYKRRLRAKSDVPIFEINGSVDKDKRQGVVKEWSETEGPAICIGIIKAMGVGLNMTAANHAQFIDKEFSPALNEQGVGRLRRIGSEHHTSIQVFEYFVRNSCEARVEAIIADKNLANELIVEGSTKSRGFLERLSAAIEGTI